MIRLLTCFLLLFVSCSSSIKEDNGNTSEEIFNEYIIALISGNMEKVFAFSSAANVEETCKYFREIAKISNDTGLFDAQLFGVNSLNELDALSDDDLYKNLIKHTLQSFKNMDSNKLSFEFIGDTFEGENTKYIVYKIETQKEVDFLDSPTVRTLKLEKEEGEWKFFTFDMGDPKFKSLALSYKHKSMQKKADLLKKEIEDISRKLDRHKDLTIEERIQRMKDKTLK